MVQWMWIGFIGPCWRIKDLEGGGKMGSKWNWNPSELVLSLKRLKLHVGFHGLFQHETMESNRKELSQAPQSTNLQLFHVAKWEKQQEKSANVICNREALFSLCPSGVSLFNRKGKFTVRQRGRRGGMGTKRDGLVHFSWVWDNEDRERERGRDKERQKGKWQTAGKAVQWFDYSVTSH